MSKGSFVYSIRVNVTEPEYTNISRFKWYKIRGQPVARGIGNLFNHVAELRAPCENLFPNLVPVEHHGKVVAFADVDDHLVDEIKRHVWRLDREGYAYFFNPILKRCMYMHRYVMDFPDSMVVDHLSWNRLDNRADHLRICTVAENNRNGTNGMMFGKKRVQCSREGQTDGHPAREPGGFFSEPDPVPSSAPIRYRTDYIRHASLRPRGVPDSPP